MRGRELKEQEKRNWNDGKEIYTGNMKKRE